MAITFDNNAVGVVNPASNTVSYTTSGVDRFLNVGTLKQSSNTITAVNYNGVPMTKEESGGWYIATEESAVWSLMNPSTGANNAVMTNSAPAGANSITISSYNGVKQTGQPEATAQFSGTGTTFTATLTTVTDNSWLVGYMRHSGTIAAGANTTLRGALSNFMVGDSNADKTPVGSYSLQFTAASSTGGLGIMAIAPAAASATIVSPVAQAATFSLPASSLIYAASVSPNAQPLTFSIPAYAVTGQALVSVNAAEATFTIPAYAIIAAGVMLSPNVQQLTFSLPTAAILSGVSLSPNTQSLTFSLPTATVTGAALVGVNPATLTLTIPTLDFVGAIWGRTARATSGVDWTRSAINNDA